MKRRDFLKLTGSTLLLSYLTKSSTGCVGLNHTRYGEFKRVPDSLVVCTYNIANARGATDNFFESSPVSKVKKRLEEIITMTKDEKIDILCLQEVDYNSKRSGNLNQAKYLRDRLGWSDLVEDHMFQFLNLLDLGTAVISKYPLTNVGVKRYYNNFFGAISHMYKGFVSCGVGDTTLINTHLDAEHEYNRVNEAKQLNEYITDYLVDRKIIVAGDLNTERNTDSYKALIRGTDLIEPPQNNPTYPSSKQVIDHILSNRQQENPRVISTINVSDHYPVITKVRR